MIAAPKERTVSLGGSCRDRPGRDQTPRRPGRGRGRRRRQQVGPGRTEEKVGPGPAADRIRAAAAVCAVTTGAQADDVVAAAALGRVVVAEGGDRVRRRVPLMTSRRGIPPIIAGLPAQLALSARGAAGAAAAVPTTAGRRRRRWTPRTSRRKTSSNRAQVEAGRLAASDGKASYRPEAETGVPRRRRHRLLRLPQPRGSPTSSSRHQVPHKHVSDGVDVLRGEVRRPGHEGDAVPVGRDGGFRGARIGGGPAGPPGRLATSSFRSAGRARKRRPTGRGPGRTGSRPPRRRPRGCRRPRWRATSFGSLPGSGRPSGPAGDTVVPASRSRTRTCGTPPAPRFGAAETNATRLQSARSRAHGVAVRPAPAELRLASVVVSFSRSAHRRR